MTESEPRSSTGFRLYRVKQLAASFWVTPRTVRRWVHDGLIKPRYKLRGGTCYELVFLESEVNRFMEENFLRPEDLDWKHEPRSRKEKAEMVRRLIGLHRLYAGKASAARMARESAQECALEGAKLEEQEEEPVILDHRPQRRQVYASNEHRDLREVGTRHDREDEEEEDTR